MLLSCNLFMSAPPVQSFSTRLPQKISPTLKLKNVLLKMNADSDEEDSAVNNNGENDEVNKFKSQADKLRQEIREMEKRLGRSENNVNIKESDGEEKGNGPMSLDNKNVLVVGANGRLGSMVCRYLLRKHPKTNVIAAAHYIGENSSTARGYGRLSYEIGAEDGVGSLGQHGMLMTESQHLNTPMK